jgi:DNA-binding LytR/AlgR family response regulator
VNAASSIQIIVRRICCQYRRPMSDHEYKRQPDNYSSTSSSHPDQNSMEEAEGMADPVGLEPLFVQEGKDLKRIDRQYITLLATEGKYVEIHTTGRRFVLRLSLCVLMKQLNCLRFCQVNRNTVINVHYLQRITPREVEVAGMRVPLSRRYRATLMQELERQN